MLAIRPQLRGAHGYRLNQSRIFSPVFLSYFFYRRERALFGLTFPVFTVSESHIWCLIYDWEV